MVELGLLENKWLYDNYPDAQSARGIGHKELFPLFCWEIRVWDVEALENSSKIRVDLLNGN